MLYAYVLIAPINDMRQSCSFPVCIKCIESRRNVFMGFIHVFPLHVMKISNQAYT